MVDCCVLLIDLLNFKRCLAPVQFELGETHSPPPMKKPSPPLLPPLNDGQEYPVQSFQRMKTQRRPRTTRSLLVPVILQEIEQK